MYIETLVGCLIQLKLYSYIEYHKVEAMNTAIILAGGIGSRVGGDIPKQFLTIKDVPIIAYTLEHFQRCADIDSIVVVCLKGWENEIEKCRNDFGIDKIIRVISGGKNSFESISAGVLGISDIMDPKGIVVIHDSVRPIISSEMISDCIDVAKIHGNGCASIPMNETIVKKKSKISGSENIDRSSVMRVQTPQAYRYDLISNLYSKAHEKGVSDSIYANTLFLEFGGEIFFSKGSETNLKVTSRKDLDIIEILINKGSVHSKKKES